MRALSRSQHRAPLAGALAHTVAIQPAIHIELRKKSLLVLLTNMDSIFCSYFSTVDEAEDVVVDVVLPGVGCHQDKGLCEQQRLGLAIYLQLARHKDEQRLVVCELEVLRQLGDVVCHFTDRLHSEWRGRGRTEIQEEQEVSASILI